MYRYQLNLLYPAFISTGSTVTVPLIHSLLTHLIVCVSTGVRSRRVRGGYYGHPATTTVLHPQWRPDQGHPHMHSQPSHDRRVQGLHTLPRYGPPGVSAPRHSVRTILRSSSQLPPAQLRPTVHCGVSCCGFSLHKPVGESCVFTFKRCFQ